MGPSWLWDTREPWSGRLYRDQQQPGSHQPGFPGGSGGQEARDLHTGTN